MKHFHTGAPATRHAEATITQLGVAPAQGNAHNTPPALTAITFCCPPRPPADGTVEVDGTLHGAQAVGRFSLKQ
ncbi:MAG TPA: hypothetical protein PKE57_02980 [Cellvibrionaceae bacterium]|nr:hypothetical protein [Cellvibrionaceae bacterium]